MLFPIPFESIDSLDFIPAPTYFSFQFYSKSLFIFRIQVQSTAVYASQSLTFFIQASLFPSKF